MNENEATFGQTTIDDGGANLSAGLVSLLEKAEKGLRQLRALCDKVSQGCVRVDELQVYRNAAAIEKSILEKIAQMRCGFSSNPQPNEVPKSITVTVIVGP